MNYPFNGNGEGVGLPHQPYNQWQGVNQVGTLNTRGGQMAQGQLQAERDKLSLHGNRINLPNEPQDFAAFNEYLNPIHADAELQSSIERWRRDPTVNKKIYSFVKNKCCVSGCRFPDEYYKLDRIVNICG